MKDSRYGTDSIRDSGANYAILDTGTSLIAIAESDYHNFVLKVMT